MSNNILGSVSAFSILKICFAEYIQSCDNVDVQYGKSFNLFKFY